MHCGCSNKDLADSWFQWHITNSTLLKPVSKPDSLLLEDQRCETSSEGHHQIFLLFLLLTVTMYTPISIKVASVMHDA